MATGVESKTLNGSDQLSYSAARMRNVMRMERPKTTPGGDALLGGLFLIAHARVVEAHAGGHRLVEDVLDRVADPG